MRAWCRTVQTCEDIGDFGVDLAKAHLNNIQPAARRAGLQFPPRPLQFEKADPEIGFVSGNSECPNGRSAFADRKGLLMGVLVPTSSFSSSGPRRRLAVDTLAWSQHDLVAKAAGVEALQKLVDESGRIRAIALSVRRCLTENVLAGPEEDGIADTCFAAARRKYAGDRDGGPQSGIMRVLSFGAAQPHEIDDPCGALRIDAGFAGRNGDFGVTVVVTEVQRDHAIEQGVLRAVDTRVFGWVRGEDSAEARMNIDVTFAAAVQSWDVEDTLRQDTQKRIIGFRPASIEFIIDDRMPKPAGGRDAIVDPKSAALFFQLDDRSDIIIDDARLMIAALASDQIGAAEFVVAMQKDRRAAELRGDMEGKRRLARTRWPQKCTA